MTKEEMEPSGVLEDSLFTSRSNKEDKGKLLNKIVNDLMENTDSILAVIIADWQGLSFASKLPKGVNEEEISATTLFTLEGAEGTRKELEKTLLGDKLSYLIMVTERKNKPAYMILFPIDGGLGYIACISQIREDMGVIIQNMKTAAKKAAQILVADKGPDQKTLENIDALITPKYNQLMKKLDALKNVKLPFLETPKTEPEIPQIIPSTPINGSLPPPEIPMAEAPSVTGPPTPPDLPMDFIDIEDDEDSEPDIIPVHTPALVITPASTPVPTPDPTSIPFPAVVPTLPKFQVTFKDSKGVKYTVILEAQDEVDAQAKIRNRSKVIAIEILNVMKL